VKKELCDRMFVLLTHHRPFFLRPTPKHPWLDIRRITIGTTPTLH